MAVGGTHGGDGMVEEGQRNLLVLRLTDMDEHGIGFQTGGAKHRDQQGCFVAADAGAVLEGTGDVVRLVAGGVLLDGNAHVADF